MAVLNRPLFPLKLGLVNRLRIFGLCHLIGFWIELRREEKEYEQISDSVKGSVVLSDFTNPQCPPFLYMISLRREKFEIAKELKIRQIQETGARVLQPI